MTTHKAQEAGSGFRLRNWRVRSRLIALILVPTAAAVLFGGMQVLASARAATEYRRANELARLSDRIGALTHELARERDRAAWYIALGRPRRQIEPLRRQMGAVDEAVAHVRDSGVLLKDTVSGRTENEVEIALTRLNGLGALREQMLDTSVRPDAAVDAYSAVITDLLSLHDELGKGSDDDTLFGQALTLGALARAKEALSLQRALLSVVLVAGRFEREQLERFLGARAAERNERGTFAAEAGSEERGLFDKAVAGRAADRVEFLRELVLLRASSGAWLRRPERSKQDDAVEWYDTVTAVIDRMREVERRHTQAVVARSQSLGDAEQAHALLVAGAVAGLLLAVLLITTGVAHSLVKPLRRLRGEALKVAEDRLPAYVQRVRESRDGEVAGDVVPIGVLSRDEIGEVARAFDEVHREAVRLAGDEARLRATVNAMFVNLSRRSQTLVERQLTLVERLERGERDDQRLADLFTLDHLATRMRRNSENLLVLAGHEVKRRRRQPVELLDVVRASLSEVENYDRVVIRIQSEAAIAGAAVSDVVHLLAELVENALSFSPKDNEVVVSSRPVEGGVMVTVTDQGIGMTPGEVERINERLAGPQVADASVARRMGLFVVGRLALKHGIRVRLHVQEAGTTAMVLLPEALLTALLPVSGGASRPAALSLPALPAVQVPRTRSSAAGTASGALAVPAVRDVPVIPQQSGSPEADETGGGAPPAASSRPPSVGGDRPSSPPAAPPGPRPEPAPAEAAAAPPPREKAPAAEASEEFLPIYASVESGWFRVGALESAAEAEAGGGEEPGEPDRPDRPGRAGGAGAPVSWASPGDAGWRAAEAAGTPALGGTTSSGLPRRAPRANLVPGSVAPPGEPLRREPQIPVSPEQIRSRMSSFQQGVRRARNEIPKWEN